MNVHFRYGSLEDVKREISETVSQNELYKLVFAEMFKFVGKSVSVRISNHLKEVFANHPLNLSFWIQGESTDLNKILRISYWSEAERSRKDFSVYILSRTWKEEFGKISLDGLKKNFGIEYRSEWISKNEKKLESGEWELYFQKIVEFEKMYNEIKEMEG